MNAHRKLVGGLVSGTRSYTTQAGQSPDAGPIELWMMGALGRDVSISMEWGDDADEPSPRIAMELYHSGELIAEGEAHADYGIVPLFRDVLAKARPVHRQEGPLRDDGTGGDGFHRV